ncbi:MAG: hypothetical protein JSR55_07245 [Proteobacteria bacterium]|nr:hypothetical protein [Pseudomonadota bacterium]
MAGPRDDVLEAMGKCAAITDSKARLDCYDAVAPRLRDALNQPPETLSHPPTKEEQQSWFGFNLGSIFGTSPDKQTTPQQFGSDQLPAPATSSAPAAGAAPVPEVIDSITAKLTDYSFTPFHKFIIFLDNGQVWRQIQGDSEIAHFSRAAADNTVTIERGAIGSYNLRINDSNKIFKVSRVK